MSEEEKTVVEISDRYTATGNPHPNPWTICRGHCEGTGFYCPKCNGTGRRINGRLGLFLDLLWTYWHPFHTALWALNPRNWFEDESCLHALAYVREGFQRRASQGPGERKAIWARWRRLQAKAA